MYECAFYLVQISLLELIERTLIMQYAKSTERAIFPYERT